MVGGYSNTLGRWDGSDGYENGGKGGNGCKGQASNLAAGSGAGNPAGYDRTYNEGKNGTGGLIIIYAEEIRNNNGKIQSKGENGGRGHNSGGGGSGGGSINIFYKNSIEQGDINSTGGIGGASVGSKVKGGDRRRWFNNNRKYLNRNICKR